MSKLTRTAKNLDIVLRILFWLMIVCGIAALVGAVAGFILQATGVGVSQLHFGIELDFVNLELAKDVLPTVEIAKMQQLISLIGVASLTLGMVLGAYFVKLLRNILQPMKEGLPFHTSVGTSLKKMAWLQLIGGGILSIIELVMENLVIYGFNLKELLLSDKISGVTFHMDLDLSFLIAAAVCFLLSYIFRYGTELQELSDETL